MKMVSVVYKIDSGKEEQSYREIKELLMKEYRVKETDIRPFVREARL